MSKILEVKSALDLCNKQREFLNSCMNFHIEYDLMFEKDADEIKELYNNLKEYRINEIHKECESLTYILNNMNNIKEKEINGIKLLKAPFYYRVKGDEPTGHTNRCVLKIGNTVLKIRKDDKNAPDCWNWCKMNSLLIEIYFQKLSKKLIKNSEIKDMVIVPEIYNYGIFKSNGETYSFIEAEYIEDAIANQISCNIENIDEITIILSKYVSKYKNCIRFINTNLSLYCIDDVNISKYIFNIEDVSEEIKKMGVRRVLEKCYIILSTYKYETNELVFNPNIYMSKDDKLVLIDFDSYSRIKTSKYYFFRLFKIVWTNEVIKNWEYN